MTTLVNGAESQSPGTAYTTGGSGGNGDDAFDAGATSGGDVLEHDNTHVARGACSYKYVPANAINPLQVRWNSLGGFGVGVATVYFRYYLWLDANPVTNWTLNRVMLGSNNRARLQVNTTGKVRVLDNAGSNIVAFTNSLALSAWNRIEARFTPGAANGTFDVRQYLGDSTTLVEQQTGTGAAFGGTNTDGLWWGNPLASNQGSSARTYWFDAFEVNDTGFPGPAAPDPQATRALIVPSRAVHRVANW